MGRGYGRAARAARVGRLATVGEAAARTGKVYRWHDISVAHQRTAPASGRLREKSSNALAQPTIICDLLVLNPSRPPARAATHLCTLTAHDRLRRTNPLDATGASANTVRWFCGWRLWWSPQSSGCWSPWPIEPRQCALSLFLTAGPKTLTHKGCSKF